MTNLLDRERFGTEPEFEDELEWFDEYEDEQLEADLEHEDELEWFDYELEDFSNRRLEQERQAIASAIRQGNRDENKLANMVFFRRHPERQGRKLNKNEPNFKQLSREWLDIRNQLVRPALATSRGTAPKSSATLADLNLFSRRFVRQMIAASRRIDCADLAIELWIRFGAQYGIPVSFKIWDASNRRWLIASSSGVRVQSTSTLVKRFNSVSEFVRYVQQNLGAQGLIGNTYPISGGHRAAVAGDVFLWQYKNNRTGKIAGIGHTQIVDRVIQSAGQPSTDQIVIVQGNLPPTIPEFYTRPASYFYRPRTATINGEPHQGLLVGTEPRRFNAFRHLR